MSHLYKDLAEVYEAMYATFIDYQEEYIFYSRLFHKYQKNNLLELGSGTGNLAAHFIKNGFTYLGLDYSEEMVNIARKKYPTADFMIGDMRSFNLKKIVQGVVMAGRTISYLRTNEDVNNTFKSVGRCLEKGGILCFDFIDANRFIPEIAGGKEITHEAIYKGIHYLRESKWTAHLVQGMDFHWSSTYYKKEKNSLLEIGKDDSIIRTFTKDELIIFLELNQFEVKEIIDKTSYAFPTYVIVGEKR